MHVRLQTWSPRQSISSASGSMFCLCVVLATVLSDYVLWKRAKTFKSTRIQVGLWRWLCCSEYDDCLWKGEKFQARWKFKCYSIDGMSDRFDRFYSSKLFKDVRLDSLERFWTGLFRQVGHTPEVYSLSLEIDKLLRITSGHRLSLSIDLKMTGTVWHLSEFYCELTACLPLLHASCLQVALLVPATDAFE